MVVVLPGVGSWVARVQDTGSSFWLLLGRLYCKGGVWLAAPDLCLQENAIPLTVKDNYVT